MFNFFAMFRRNKLKHDLTEIAESLSTVFIDYGNLIASPYTDTLIDTIVETVDENQIQLKTALNTITTVAQEIKERMIEKHPGEFQEANHLDRSLTSYAETIERVINSYKQ